MTDRELMQQALDALQSSVPTQDGFLKHCKAMNHIRIRLTQPEQEPVAWITEWKGVHSSGKVLDFKKHRRGGEVTHWPLYTTPPQRKPLTDEEIEACRQQGYDHSGLSASFDFVKAARAVEAAHGIKGEA